MSDNKELMQQEETVRKYNFLKNKKMLLSVVMIVVAALAIAVTLAWFFTQRSVATVTEVRNPSNLSLVGANEGELKLDMSPSDSDAVSTDSGVVLKRVFGVKSKNNHWLEIAHTTNTDHFSFQIYQATAKNDESGEYAYDQSKPIYGQYLNAIASESATGKTADPSISPFYEENFQSNDKVQQNTVPLYWMSCQLPADSSGVTYYYLEVKWDEVDKETNVFYIFVSDSITQ